ncbi:hypothetical protein C7401_15714 [Paraburkholderia unamae]|uniref:aspartate/glutamate racemase family protein n=1 Tax=Paraburkholderia unamae TaxID=219649 RepID=UPI000DC24129|nr:aspartate/glutamate racemase family protein [Paraburkholderia unamae]RAR47920.1 hypothetical protein C7401_15714 [Paraburkholderia unamae]
MNSKTRISLIHATSVAIQPINESFRRLWPDATVYNLLEDSLTADLERAGGDIMVMAHRFSALVRYSRDTGADGILFTCSSFGPAVEAARASIDVPVLKPNEAMIDEALGIGRKIALVATFQPALEPIMQEFDELASGIEFNPIFVEGALAALKAGDQETHDQLIAEACALASQSDVVCFAQFSMTSAHAAAEAAARRPTLTTTDSAVKSLKKRLSR